MSTHINVHETVAGVGNSRAMESETIQKNGVSPKNHRSRGNFTILKYALLFIACLVICSMACKKDKSDISTPLEPPSGGGTEPGTYLGIIGFASDINSENLDLLTDGTKNKYKSFIDYLPMSDATKLYYSVKLGLETLVAAQYPPDLENVSIITFTDGLDQGSNDERGDLTVTSEQWLNEINALINKKINNKEIKAYSIGINDAIKPNEEAQFEKNIKSLASEGCWYVVNDMADVNQTFTDIAHSLYKVSTSQSVELKINSKDLGTEECFTFDGGNWGGASGSQLYIKGTLYASGQELGLKNIEYSSGLSSSSGNDVVSTQKGGKRCFTFQNLIRSNGESVPTDDIKEFYTLADGSWTENPEFKNEGGITATVEQKSAMIMLVLDCSSSLQESGFSKMKDASKNFIEVLLGGGTPTVPVTGVTLNKSTLTLAAAETETLYATIQPSDATNKNVTWASSNPAVATVTNGEVTAVTTGTANITVITKSGNKTATCAVTVKAASLPTLSTAEATNVTGSSATLGGNITEAGVPAYTEKGICYSTSENPTTSSNKVEVSGNETGFYTTTVTDLSPSTTYYVRAYAINAAGTAYGKQVSFKTSDNSVPVLSTQQATYISTTSATLGGNISNAGTPAYTERGVCYSTSQNPTTSNNKTVVSGSGTGSYTTDVFNLSANTTYYVRAYAINSVGTAYGDQVSFKTENVSATNYILDDGSAETGWRINPGYEVSLGNEFAVGESGELISIDVYGQSADDAGSKTVIIDIYNAYGTRVGSSSSFTLPKNQWKNVTLNKIPYSGTFYVMVRWSASSGETNYLGMDLDGYNATSRLGYYISDGEWYVFEDIFDYGSDNYYSARGVWMIRANAYSAGKSISYGPEMTTNKPTAKVKASAASQCKSSK
ncbi:MAG: Ig-like domain-containing protein [Bacteroidales bacterium]|nr:Ig-like domain-containing protein [Bacteroidales bacterium]